ncbi:hypothetical protein OROGR_028637 [Orobanche gracilis]
MTADRGSWRRRIRVSDSFLGSDSVVESLRVWVSRGLCAEPNLASAKTEFIEYEVAKPLLGKSHVD